MVDAPTSNIHPSEEVKEEYTLESIAVAGASAIQRLISERDDLRVRANKQQGNLVQLTAANVELRRCIISIRQHYVELATKVLAQLEQFDHTTRDLMQERGDWPFAGRGADASLVSLAHRLKPAAARPPSVGNLDD